jgi:flagellar biogenesis protein FliO
MNESFRIILSIIGVIAIILAIFLALYRLRNFKHKLKHAGVGDQFDIVMME